LRGAARAETLFLPLTSVCIIVPEPKFLQFLASRIVRITTDIYFLYSRLKWNGSSRRAYEMPLCFRLDWNTTQRVYSRFIFSFTTHKKTGGLFSPPVVSL